MFPLGFTDQHIGENNQETQWGEVGEMDHTFTTAEHTSIRLYCEWFRLRVYYIRPKCFYEWLVGGWGWIGCGCCVRTGIIEVAVHSGRCVGDEARSAGTGNVGDPVLVLGHTGVASRSIGPGAAVTEAHDSTLDPNETIFGHHRAPGVSLGKEMDGCWNKFVPSSFRSFLCNLADIRHVNSDF